MKNSHQGAPLVQYTQLGNAVLIGVFTESNSPFSSHHALFVRISAVITDGFLPIEELASFLEERNSDDNANEKRRGNIAQMKFERKASVHQEQTGTNDVLTEDAIATTEPVSDEGESDGSNKKKKKDDGPTAMAVISYIGLAFIGLVLTSACITVNIFENR